ncbi:sulfatase family protein [Gluconacetobacter takamatsuzukensis]|uniref:Sulfatase n=1 Tax=Gluconacetobacter takamatsuzukensis TaxID=1286190 RepID=A0A7W4KF82_9PROT|nr:sulfatase [Gluconacetobacter takamatsuzukensis]MBB2205894.1 sulfatase [Gluconacetobacter takamatsuzukensis]
MSKGITRRALFAAGAAFSASPGLARAAAPRDPQAWRAKRPNILFLLADDWSWTSADTHDDLKLAIPAYRRLCEEGVSFSNAFVACPSCSASRASILTGQWPWELEEGANLAGTLDARFQVYPELLEQSGYFVGMTRKGWAPGQLAPGHRTQNPAGKSYESFANFLDHRPEGAPFCFWFGSHDPHRPYEIDRGAHAGIDPGRVDVPPYLPDVAEVRGDMADYAFGVERFNREAGELIARLEASGELENTLIVMTGDNGWPFPRGKASLYDSGIHVPFVIRWGGIERPGRVVDAIISTTDLAPTFLTLAGVAIPHDMVGTSLLPWLDGEGAMPKREYTLAGMERHMDVRQTIGWGYPMRAIRTADFLYIRNFEPGRMPAGVPSVHPQTAATLTSNVYAGYGDIDQGRAKAYIVTHRDDPAVKPYFDRATALRPARELYRVTHDRYDMQNLAELPEFRSVADRLDRELIQALKATHDPRQEGHGALFDHYRPYNDPGFKRPDVI